MAFARFVNVFNVSANPIQVFLDENDTPLTTVAYGASSEYLPIPVGIHTLSTVFSNAPDDVTSSTIFFFENCRDYTILLAFGTESSLYTQVIVVYPDDNSCCKAPKLRFINALTGSVNLLADGYTVFSNVGTDETGLPQFVSTKPCLFNFSLTGTDIPPTVLINSFPFKFKKCHNYTFIPIVQEGTLPPTFTFLVLASRCHDKKCHK